MATPEYFIGDRQMKVSVDWYDQNRRIMLKRYVGRWDWPSFVKAQTTPEGLLDSVSHPVSVIIDAQDYEIPPEILTKLPQIAQSRIAKHPNLAHVIIVSASPFVNLVAQMFIELYAGDLLVDVAPSVDQALSIAHHGGPGQA
ncbi:MAG: hypothetical protein GYB68_15790 [Chloroflexi bacterium]|nr:hypothetical protein [Chloroflexota bacterium]